MADHSAIFSKQNAKALTIEERSASFVLPTDTLMVHYFKLEFGSNVQDSILQENSDGLVSTFASASIQFVHNKDFSH